MSGPIVLRVSVLHTERMAMHRAIRALWAAVCAAMVVSGQAAWAQGPPAQARSGQGALAGTIVDSLGARVTGASVVLLHEGGKSSEAKTDSDGTFSFPSLTPGRYQVMAAAQGFTVRTSDPVYVGAGARVSVEVALEIGPLQQDVVVTAEAGGVLQTRTGAPVTV